MDNFNVSRCIYEYFSVLYGYIYFDIFLTRGIYIYIYIIIYSSSKGMLIVKKFHQVKSSCIQKLIVLVDG
jgi:hypothetical protein